VQPRQDVSSYFVSTLRQGAPSMRFRAVIYAPGCAFRTVDLPVSGPSVPQYSFVCEPLPRVTLTGNLGKSDLEGHEISLEAKYVARWVQDFVGPGDGVITDIPIGAVQHAFVNGSFQLSVPDLAQDPLAGASDHAGELRIVGRDRTSGKIVAQLVPAVPFLRTRMGGLQIRKEYPASLEFATCTTASLVLHDAGGFAIRGSASEACDR